MSDFATIYEQERGKVFAYLLKSTRNWHVAEDLTADVFEVALRKYSQWEDRGIPYDHYLRRVAHYCITLWCRQWRRQYRLRDDDDEQDPALAVDGGIDALLDQMHTAFAYALLKAALGKLKPRQQQAITLRFGLGLSENDAARQMGLSYQTYHALLKNTLERLSSLMVNRQSPPPMDVVCETCQEPGCGRPHHAHGKCRRCWKAWYRKERRWAARNELL